MEADEVMDGSERYDFGSMCVWPKPVLDTPYDVLDHYHRMVGRLERLGGLVNISCGRPDHLVRSLDTALSALGESMMDVMVLRETLTGSKTLKEAMEKREAGKQAP